MFGANYRSGVSGRLVSLMFFKGLLPFAVLLFCVSLLLPWTLESKAGSGHDPPSSVVLAQSDITFDPQNELGRLNRLIKGYDKNADLFYNRGWVYEYLGDLKNAEKDYSEAIEINRNHADAYYNRGLIYAGTKRYGKAIKDFSEAIRLKPGSVDAYCNRGKIYFMQGKTAQALEDYNRALEIDPEDGELYYNRAVVYSANGVWAKAMEDFEEAARLGNDKAIEYLGYDR